MKYIIAIIHTITLIVFPLFTIPFLQWYKLTFCQPNTELYPVYIIMTFISIGMLVMTIIRWVVALRDDKHINF
jgi:uncharacterized membrane protein